MGRIVDYPDTQNINETDKIFINQENALKQITKENLLGGISTKINNLDVKQTTFEDGTEIATAEGGILIDEITGQTEKSSNLWDEQWELGSISNTTGQNSTSTNLIRSKNYIEVNASTFVYVNGSGKKCNLYFYNLAKTFISYLDGKDANSIFTVPNNTKYIRFMLWDTYGTTYKNDIAIIEGTSGEYEPYGLSSVGDMGYFDGELLQGRWSTSDGSFATNSNYVSTANIIPCKANDNIDISCAFNTIYVVFYNNGNFKSGQAVSNKKITIPSGVNGFRLNFYSDTPVTPQTAGHICVTINGQYAIIVDEHNKNYINKSDIVIGKDWHERLNDKVASVKFNLEVGRKYTVFAKLPSEITDVSFVSMTGTNTYDWYHSAPYTFTATQTTNALSINSSVNMTQAIIDKCNFVVCDNEPKTIFIPLSQPLHTDDYISKVDGKYKEYHKYAEVDLGTLNWSATTKNRLVSNGISDLVKPGASSTSVANIICNALEPTTQARVEANSIDNSIAIGTNGNIVVYASNYIDNPTDFKNAMQGVKLIYELVTPTLTDCIDQSAFYQLETYEDKTYVRTADSLTIMDISYGEIDVVAKAINGERLGELNSVEIDEVKSVVSGTTNVSNIKWCKCGNVVTVSLYQVASTSGALREVTGLPKPFNNNYIACELFEDLTAKGYLTYEAPKWQIKLNGTAYGSFTYICE